MDRDITTERGRGVFRGRKESIIAAGEERVDAPAVLAGGGTIHLLWPALSRVQRMVEALCGRRHGRRRSVDGPATR